jgi:hypothetical protein
MNNEEIINNLINFISYQNDVKYRNPTDSLPPNIPKDPLNLFEFYARLLRNLRSNIQYIQPNHPDFVSRRMILDNNVWNICLFVKTRVELQPRKVNSDLVIIIKRKSTGVSRNFYKPLSTKEVRELVDQENDTWFEYLLEHCQADVNWIDDWRETENGGEYTIVYL